MIQYPHDQADGRWAVWAARVVRAVQVAWVARVVRPGTAQPRAPLHPHAGLRDGRLPGHHPRPADLHREGLLRCRQGPVRRLRLHHRLRHHLRSAALRCDDHPARRRSQRPGAPAPGNALRARDLAADLRRLRGRGPDPAGPLPSLRRAHVVAHGRRSHRLPRFPDHHPPVLAHASGPFRRHRQEPSAPVRGRARMPAGDGAGPARGAAGDHHRNHRRTAGGAAGPAPAHARTA